MSLNKDLWSKKIYRFFTPFIHNISNILNISQKCGRCQETSSFTLYLIENSKLCFVRGVSNSKHPWSIKLENYLSICIICIKRIYKFHNYQPTIGVEPITVGLQNRCSTNWAKQALLTGKTRLYVSFCHISHTD